MNNGLQRFPDFGKDLRRPFAVQRTVLWVQQGKGCGAERFMRYAVDREMGKGVEHLVIDGDPPVIG
ncbi:MAG: hypothetical protein ACYTAS_07095 [Planctomycetota bacterium]|jgi:hypothetical protein